MVNAVATRVEYPGLVSKVRTVYLARLSEHLSELAEMSTANSHYSVASCIRQKLSEE